MEIKSRFDHFNINVTDLDRSIAFYDKALGLRETGRKEASDGGFTLQGRIPIQQKPYLQRLKTAINV